MTRPKAVNNQAVSTEQLNKLIEDIKTKFRASFNSLTEEFKKIKEEFMSETRELKESVRILKLQMIEKDVIIDSLVSQVNHLDQYGRHNNFELSNIQEVEGENVESIVLKVATALGIELVASDIEAAHRIPPRTATTKPARVIVRLLSRKKRDLFLAKRKEVITNQHIGLQSTQRIYVNDNLAPFYRELLWKSKIKAKEQDFKFVWFKNGKILVRKNENTRQALVINSFGDLDKIQ